jgi:glycosyltransferase involved in cell wall biosynthesis
VEQQRIIFTVTNELTYDQRMIRICTSLVNAGFDVLLIGRKKHNAQPLTDQLFQQKRLSCFFQKGKLFYLEYNIRLLFFLLFQKVHIISAVDLDTLVACTLAAKIKSKMLAFDAHEYFEEVPEVVNRPLIQKIWKQVGLWFIPQANITYTVNHSLATLFANMYHKPFKVIRSLPYRYGHVVKQKKEQKTILYQGALNKGRGLEFLIRAMAQIDAQLLIAGEGDLSGQLRNMAYDLALQHKITFLGYVEPDQLKHITAKANIGFNVMEPQGLSYYYSLANKFFDYIQAEVPQICSPFPEYEYLNLQHEVAVFCNCNVNEIANTINDLLQDSNRYRILQQNCQQAKQQFCWDIEEEKLVTLYRNAKK